MEVQSLKDMIRKTNPNQKIPPQIDGSQYNSAQALNYGDQ